MWFRNPRFVFWPKKTVYSFKYLVLKNKDNKFQDNEGPKKVGELRKPIKRESNFSVGFRNPVRYLIGFIGAMGHWETF